MWKVSTTGEFDEWFADLTAAAQVEIIARVELLKTLGPHLHRPHADTLKGSRHANMKELRAETAESVLRVAFAFDPSRSAILLCAGDKKGVNQRRFYKRLIELADALYDDHVRAIRKKQRGRE